MAIARYDTREAGDGLCGGWGLVQEWLVSA
jgi:hypothetical protein